MDGVVFGDGGKGDAGDQAGLRAWRAGAELLQEADEQPEQPVTLEDQRLDGFTLDERDVAQELEVHLQLGRGTESDPHMTDELRPRAEGVSLSDVCGDRHCGPTQLIEHAEVPLEARIEGQTVDP